ncbi:MAG: hypothetical protein M9935_07155 [Kiritimatiellae bacterium]|nr:hypothetical protein [Kiritimatiellia bacterium]
MKHQLALRGVLEPRSWKLQRAQRAGVQQVDDLAAVHAVASQTVRMPRENTRRFPGFDASKHLVEDGPARSLGRLLLHVFGNDVQSLGLGKIPQLKKLRIDGEDLLVLHVG